MDLRVRVCPSRQRPRRLWRLWGHGHDGRPGEAVASGLHDAGVERNPWTVGERCAGWSMWRRWILTEGQKLGGGGLRSGWAAGVQGRGG